MGFLKNLTPEGLMLLSHNSYNKDMTYRVIMLLPGVIQGKQEIAIDIRSRWSKREIDTSNYTTGFSIVNKEEHLQKLKELIEHFAMK